MQCGFLQKVYAHIFFHFHKSDYISARAKPIARWIGNREWDPPLLVRYSSRGRARRNNRIESFIIAYTPPAEPGEYSLPRCRSSTVLPSTGSNESQFARCWRRALLLSARPTGVAALYLNPAANSSILCRTKGDAMIASRKARLTYR